MTHKIYWHVFCFTTKQCFTRASRLTDISPSSDPGDSPEACVAGDSVASPSSGKNAGPPPGKNGASSDRCLSNCHGLEIWIQVDSVCVRISCGVILFVTFKTQWFRCEMKETQIFKKMPPFARKNKTFWQSWYPNPLVAFTSKPYIIHPKDPLVMRSQPHPQEQWPLSAVVPGYLQASIWQLATVG